MAVDELPEPVPGPGTAVVRVERAGICGSDVGAYRGTMGIARPGDVRGHELAGVVTGVGDAGDAGWIGTSVAVDSQITCGRCWACTAGRGNLCPELRIVGVHVPGGFAERVAVPVRNLVPVPAGVTAELAATAEPLAQACHDVRLVLPTGPENCLVVGAGSIGNLLVQALRLSGVPGVDVVEPDPARRRAAEEVGAATAVGSTDQAGAPAARLPRGGYDVVFDVVGSERTRAAAVELVRRGGSVVMVGLHADVTALPWFTVVRHEIALLGANCYAGDDFAQAVRWLAEGRIALGSPVRSATLEEAPQVFADLADGRATAAKTFLVPAP
jgi:2-desacetyl-2-hydroxyethyl bacteriochlorophyllide A dehydrogenase